MVSYYDEFMVHIGHFGVYQKVMVAVFLIYPLTLGPMCMTSRYSLATVTFQCEAKSQNNILSVNRPLQNDETEPVLLKTEAEKDSCHVVYQWTRNYNQTMSDAHLLSTADVKKQKVKCKSFQASNEFMKTTATSDFQLFCDREYLKSIAEVIFPVGMMIGLLVAGQVGDMFGRKPVLIAAILINMVACVLEGLTFNTITFMITRFSVGFACTAIYLAFFTLGCEMIPENKVLLFGFLGESVYGTGLAILAAVAHFLRKWRYIQVAGGLLATPALIAAFFSPESLRWLVTTGRRERVEKLARQIASINGREFDESVLSKMNSAIDKMAMEKEQKTSATEEILLLLRIFRTPKLNMRVSILAFCWAVTCGVYFSFSISGSLIPGNIFVNLAVMGLLETPAMCIAYPIGVKLGRRFLNAGALLFAGASCMTMVFTTIYDYRLISQILAQCGKFGVTITFAVIYVYSSELIPTCARVTGLSFCSFSARITTIASLYIILMSENVWKPSIYLIYGSLAFLAGTIALTLPETLNCTLQDNFEDAILFEGSKRNGTQMAEKSENNGLVCDVERYDTNGVGNGKMAASLHVSSA